MVWAWSHTIEAYLNLKTNIAGLPPDQLQCIWAEILTSKFCQKKQQIENRLLYPGKDMPVSCDEFDENFYNEALEVSTQKAASQLVEEIFSFAQNQALCSEGGYQDYVCPYGCHTLPFNLLN
ncbi:hypothetical protein K9N68_37525 (plasmid) [Kovacikia minuta CCNUW1]|uniref:hypothetical protein n=1 Tax=Kovacikia minuta TaxID=2931930 RepID=UPI001CCC1B4B|nr:hypothetical protein [Kovacikia minuta]UBF29914.1 hypothetical protein K9N68_37525 [Kovacikia minuta CCNUW1]